MDTKSLSKEFFDKNVGHDKHHQMNAEPVTKGLVSGDANCPMENREKINYHDYPTV